MLWSTQYESFPEFNRLLDNHANKNEGCSLERLFFEEGFLQELQNNERLQKFLTKRHQLKKLISYAFTETCEENKNISIGLLENEGCNDKVKISLARAAHLSVEVLLSDSWPITQAIITDQEMLELILKTPLKKSGSISSRVAERLSKVIGHLLICGPVELGGYVRQEWDKIQQFIIPCLADAYMSELLLRLWVASCPHPESVSQSFAHDLITHLNPTSNNQLFREAVFRLLLDLLTLSLPSDSASQHPASHIVSILMSLKSTDQLIDYLLDTTQSQTSASNLVSLFVTLLQWPTSHLFHTHYVPTKNFVIRIINRANDIQHAINSHKLSLIETSTGAFIPLGPLRLKAAELWTQLLRIASNSRQQDLSSKLISLDFDSNENLTDTICRSLFDLDIVGWLIGLVMEFPWHNIFHNVFYEFVQTLLIWMHPPSTGKLLILELFTTHCLVTKLLEGHRKQGHVGYLGHFIQIGDDIVRFLTGLKATDGIHTSILEAVNMQGWHQYLEECLLPAQKKAMGGEMEETSMFGEWRLKHIMSQDDYPEDELDELDSLKQYSLEDNLEFDIDLHYEDDEDTKDNSYLMPDLTNMRETWARDSLEDSDEDNEQDEFLGDWSFERCDSISTRLSYAGFDDESGVVAFDDSMLQTSLGDEDIDVNLADDEEGLGVKLDIFKASTSHLEK